MLVCGDFLVCWCGKVGVGGGCFIASLYVVPGWARRCTACGCLFYRESVRGSLICLGGAWAGRLRRRYSPCHAAARRWLRYRRCYRRCYGWQRMTPARRAFHECRMQFPQHRATPRNHIVGIATFADTVESSFNRIACETAPSALAACVPRRARGPAHSRVGSTPRAWTRYCGRRPPDPRVGGALAHI